MPKLRVLSAAQVCEILQEHGFAKSRVHPIVRLYSNAEIAHGLITIH